MPVAFQTICWGDTLQAGDWPRVLDLLKAAGYAGVEIFQKPSALPPPEELYRLAGERKLEILGFSGGALVERVGWLEGIKFTKEARKPYLYIEYWEPGSEEALAQGLTLALHYHHLSKLPSIEAAEELLKKWPSLKWLPDTAHIFIGRQTTKHVIDTLFRPELLGRTAAIHLKDWTPIYGRFSHRFTRGFRALGDGEVGMRKIVGEIQKRFTGKDSWVVVELDYARSTPDEDMWGTAKTMAGWEMLPEPREDLKAEVARRGFPSPVQTEPPPFRADLMFQKASRCEDDFYPQLASVLLNCTQAQEVLICSLVSSTGQPTIRGRAARVGFTELLSRDEAKRIARRAAEAKESNVEVAQVESESTLLAVPVLNRFNPNLVRQVMVFRYDPQASDAAEKVAKHPSLAATVGDAVDVYLTEKCLSAAARAARLTTAFESSKELLDETAKLLRESLRCEGVTVFQWSPSTRRLKVGGTTGINWLPGRDGRARDHYEHGHGITGAVLASRSYAVHRHDSRDQTGPARHVPATSSESVTTPMIDSCLSACVFDREDHRIGVVRCRNPIGQNGEIIYFCEDDLSIVEAVMQVVQPALETFDEDRRRRDAFTLLSHELSNPITAMRGAIVDTNKDLGLGEYDRDTSPFKYDYLGQMEGWLDLMVRQLKQYEMAISGRKAPLTPRRQRVFFFADIVAPVVSQLRAQLEQRGFSPKKISYGELESWKSFPALWVDKSMFVQVVFNVLGNAIKYAHSDPNRFSVRIWGETLSDGVAINFEDEGIGIPEDYRETVFERGERVLEGAGAQMPGEGLGLWLVRRIIESHDGQIKLVQWRGRGHTRFHIWLPNSAVAKRR
ncbi:MAG: hypothetical protein J0L64_20640 [Acidobacteria bacterium]|nr:hypothetical protein [Acidobacteriota bacterium]